MLETISVRLPRPLKAAVMERAEAQDMNMSMYMREILSKHLFETEKIQ